MNEKYKPSPKIAEILAHPHSTKEQAYELGYDAGKIAGIIEAHESINKIFAQRLEKVDER